MEEMVASYKGPHQIKLNRNSTNLGIGGHVNKIYTMVSGDIVVQSAGDDISLPHRVETIVSVWRTSGYPSAVWSNAISIDEKGKYNNQLLIPESIKTQSIKGNDWDLNQALGACLAFDANIIKKFGTFDSRIFQEDAVISSRALMFNGIVYLDEPLVLYRKHNSVSNLITADKDTYIKFQINWTLCRIRRYHQLERDLLKIGKSKTPAESEVIQYQYNKAKLSILNKSYLRALFTIFKYLFKSTQDARQLCWLFLVRAGFKKNF